MSTMYPTLQSVALEQGRTKFFTPPAVWKNPQIGKFTHSFDKAPPGKHTLALYNGKTHTEAAVGVDKIIRIVHPSLGPMSPYIHELVS